jgi:hypothetical protein
MASGGFFAPQESDRLLGFFKSPETSVIPDRGK